MFQLVGCGANRIGCVIPPTLQFNGEQRLDAVPATQTAAPMQNRRCKKVQDTVKLPAVCAVAGGDNSQTKAY